MAKSNKVATVVSKSVNPPLAGEVLDLCGAVASQALDVQIKITKETESLRSEFARLCILAGVPLIKRDNALVYDKESEIGKALHNVLKDKATEAAKTRDHYSVGVHRVGSEDKYLPVSIWSKERKVFEPVKGAGAVNYNFSAAFALSVDLRDVPSVAESPNGVKAWLRGTAVGERPDGKGQGIRDWIKNDIDKALSRCWAADQTVRIGGNKQDLHDLLKGLYKAGTKKRMKHEKDGDIVVSDDQWKVLCAFVAEAAFNPDMLLEHGITE